MKKIIMAVATVAMAASMFAVDFSAHVEVDGNIVRAKHGKDVTDIDFFVMEDNNQKDADLLEVHFSGDKAGADFKFFVNDGKMAYWENGSAVSGGNISREAPLMVRGVATWFMPIDMLKITVGQISQSMYTERLNWWKVPCGASYAQFKAWDHRWSSYTTADGYGIAVDVNLPVMNGLSIGAAIAPGTDQWIALRKDNDAVFAPYGVQAKLQIMDNVSVGLAWRDKGTKQTKVLTVGADFGNWGTPYYGFLQAKLNFSTTNGPYGSGHAADWSAGSKTDDVKLRGVTIDNYISYNLGFMKLEATLPITIRGFVAKDVDFVDWDGNVYHGDPSYMTARIRATVPLNSFTFSCVIGTDEGCNESGWSGAPLAWVFDDHFGDNFNLYVNPALSFNVGVAALSVGAELVFDNAADGNGTFYWGIPFTTSVSF